MLETVNHTNFTTGEISPLLLGRVDFSKFFNAARRVENLIVTPWGPATRRPGTIFVAAAPAHDKRPRLVPFVFGEQDDIQAYQLCVSDGEIEFFRDRAQMTVAGLAGTVATAISNGDFTSNITGWDDISSGGSAAIAHDATNGRLSLVGDGANTAAAEQDIAVAVADQAVEHYLKFRVLGVAGDEVSVRVGTSSGGGEVLAATAKGVGWHVVPFTPGATPVYVQFTHSTDKTLQIDDVSIASGAFSLDAPWAEADLAALKWKQSLDVLFLYHPEHHPYELKRHADDHWSLQEIDYQDGPFLAANGEATTLTPSATTGLGITLTASAVTGINEGRGFETGDVGRLVRVTHSTTNGWAVITGRTSSTVVTADVRGAFGATTASAVWRMGAWSDTTGWPIDSTFHAERDANTSLPQRMDASAVGDFPNFAPGTDDADAVSIQIGADESNRPRWLISARSLLLGTAKDCADIKPLRLGGGIFQISADTDSAAITPSNVQARTATGGTVLYVGRNKRKLHELAFSFEVDSFRDPDLTALAEHITVSGIREIAFQETPFRVLWCAREDGMLIGLTYFRDEDVVGWHRHPLGGRFGGGHPVVESVSVIPGDPYDELWLAVKRTIDGATKRYVELLADPLPDEDLDADGIPTANDGDPADAIYLDSALTLDNPVTITGITSADPVVVTAPAHGFADGDTVRLTDIVAVPSTGSGSTDMRAALNRKIFKVANKTAGAFELNTVGGAAVDGADFTAWVSGGKATKRVSSVSGLDHLEGETVQVLGDGAVQPAKTVSGGAIELTTPAAVVQVGLGATWRLRALPLDTASPSGSSQGKRKRPIKAHVRLHRTGELNVGPTTDKLQGVPLGYGRSMNAPAALFTGLAEVPLRGGARKDAELVYQGTLPLPATLVAVVPKVETAP